MASIPSDMASGAADMASKVPSLPSTVPGLGSITSGLSSTGEQLMKGVANIGKVTTPIVSGTATGTGAVLDGMMS